MINFLRKKDRCIENQFNNNASCPRFLDLESVPHSLVLEQSITQQVSYFAKGKH